jgi:hypothetical protein
MITRIKKPHNAIIVWQTINVRPFSERLRMINPCSSSPSDLGAHTETLTALSGQLFPTTKRSATYTCTPCCAANGSNSAPVFVPKKRVGGPFCYIFSLYRLSPNPKWPRYLFPIKKLPTYKLIKPEIILSNNKGQVTPVVR